VRDCREAGGDAACGSGRSCCDDGACRASCGSAAAAGGFAWQFNTGPIPLFPIVLENATCQVTEPSTMPSPNPFKGALDVCTNLVAITAVFSLPMEPATFTSTNVVLESCGTGPAISTTCAPVAGAGSARLFGDNTMLLPTGGGLDPSTWYRLTIRDQVRSTDEQPTRSAQQLDGDFDGKGGGAYVTTFKTGEGDCSITGVNVIPPEALIAGTDEQEAYDALPMSEGCYLLSCMDQSVQWTSSSVAKATVEPGGPLTETDDFCEAVATPVSETEPGPPIEIRATINQTFQDYGELTIDYANPRVTDYGPRDCDQACVNTVAFAYFNTPMQFEGPDSILSADNVKMYRCKNESCLSYIDEVTLHPTYVDRTVLNPKHGPRLLRLGNPELAPNTFYRVSIMGNVRSLSNAPLTGLNFENSAFSWTFRTRQSASPCGPQKVQIEPTQTTLRYITDVSPVTALPRTSPDACAANGQILDANSFNWGWTKAQAPVSPPAPQAIRYLPDVPPGTLLNTNPELPPGCSSACVMTGSKAPGTPTCGNGVKETGEACDTPDVDGCNAICLRTGNTQANGCGDGDTQEERGEECDAGPANGQPTAGCSTSCLFPGSSSGLSSCGNGSQGVGEACDDGNTTSGDGCGSTCTLEGSSQNAYVCGNGRLEPGEQCDYTLGAAGTSLLILGRAAPVGLAGYEQNPTRPGFACGPSCLLRGNLTKCASGLDCCGNGTIDSAKGEGCDAGAENGDPGSGCSAICTKTGSHPDLRAYCGDGGVPKVKPADPITGVENGGGEDCEAIGPDANIDGLQVVEARSQCDAKNSCTASVSASVISVGGQPISPVTGKGDVSVECSCRDDGDCSAFGAAAGVDLSCGAGSCCFVRPKKPDIEPKDDGGVCRNALVVVTFPEEMEIGSLQGGIVVEACNGFVTRSEGGNWLARAVGAVGRFFRSLFGMPATAQAVCAPIEGTFIHATQDDGPAGKRTITKFAPKQLYDADRSYRVTVRGGATGVKTLNGVGYPEGGDTKEAFTTGTEICKFDHVEMDPATELIQRADVSLPINATAVTKRASGEIQPIAPVADVYDWAWSWASIPEATPPGTLIEMTPTDPTGVSVKATKGLNGREQVLASARITTDTILTPSSVGEEKVGISVLTILLCEQPWPVRAADGSWTPYVDPATHFEFYYCRDNAGAPLPELKPIDASHPVQGQSGSEGTILRFCSASASGTSPQSCVSDADCGVGQCLSKDLFFRFAPIWKLIDAIGVRVYDNPNRLTPQEWFDAQRFSGKTQASTVDGYMAVQADRTIYVGAVDKYGDPELRPYIYVFAYNDRADARTAEVFNRLVKNVRFNTNLVPSDRVTNVCKVNGDIARTTPAAPPTICSSDLDCFAAFENPPTGLNCDSDKDKIRRDMRRWQDMSAIEAALEQTRASSGSYPELEAGSFIRGFTTSAWPSWKNLMGAAGGITDPLNRFNRCEDFGSECTISRTVCAADGECTGGTGDVCRPRFEAATCYDDRATVFACPAASHVYQYRAIGGSDYLMNFGFEYTTYPWAGADCTVKDNQFDCEAAVGCAWSQTGPGGGGCETRISTIQTCAGLFTDHTNRCLASGVPGVACSASLTCAANDACVPANVPLFGPAAAAACGNGLLERDEVCEVGATQIVPCGVGQGSRREVCRSDCKAWDIVQACPVIGANHCGNGALEAFIPESCDDGAQTGQYGRCRSGSFGCEEHCISIADRTSFDGNCSDGNGCDIGPTCNTNADCAGLSFPAVCTDRMNFCGDNIKNGPELCDDGSFNGQYGHCAWDCRGPGPRCGDLETNGTEDCDGDQRTASGVCIDAAASLADNASPPGVTQACVRDSDCATGQKCALCAVTAGGLPQTRTKSCRPPTAALACTFDNWAACKPSGACGNGKVEGAEECDKGTANSTTGECLPTCKKNICNDGFVREGVEQCDNGASNGVLCLPRYGLTCNYCDNACAIKTLTGGFCGDHVFQNAIASPPGPEQCDAAQGLSSGIVCVSTKPENQSYGRIVGFVACSVSSCQQSCTDPQARICDNRTGTTNSDKYGGVGEACPPGDPNCPTSPYRSACPAGGPIGSCTIAPTGDPRYTEQSIAAGDPAYILLNVCDPDDDNDGVPDEFDCGTSEAKVHPAYKLPSDGSVIDIPAAAEICDPYDNDCNGTINDNPNLHTKVDMVFTVDISGSMQTYINGISDAISRFVNNYRNTDHRFGLVVFGQAGPPLQTAGPNGRVVINLTDVASFQSAFSSLLANGGGIEPMYDSVYELASATNKYGINWSSDAHPYIVVVTDEPPRCGFAAGSQCTGPNDSQWKSEAQTAASVSTCHISGCAGDAGFRVETFVIAKSADIAAWDSVIYNETATRFIEIAPGGAAGSSDYYFAQLESKTFANVCAYGMSSSPETAPGGQSMASP
jgi:cysteine-rich repeat protein